MSVWCREKLSLLCSPCRSLSKGSFYSARGVRAALDLIIFFRGFVCNGINRETNMRKITMKTSPHHASFDLVSFAGNSALRVSCLAREFTGRSAYVCAIPSRRSLHPRFPQFAGGDVINAQTLTSEKYTLVSLTRRCSGNPLSPGSSHSPSEK